MLFFLTILILLSAIAAATITVLIFLRKQKSLPPAPENPAQFQPLIQYQSIFAPSEEELRAQEAADKAKRSEMLRRKILAKAESGDFAALIVAGDFEKELYDRLLKELVLRSDSAEFISLSAFIEENKLATNAEFVRRFQEIPENSSDKRDAIRFLYFAASSGSAEIFSDAIENVLKLCRGGRFKDFTQENLIQLAESHVWLLPQAEKTSGAGFLLKQKLAKLRSAS